MPLCGLRLLHGMQFAWICLLPAILIDYALLKSYRKITAIPLLSKKQHVCSAQNRIKLQSTFMNDGWKQLFHTNGRTTAVYIASQRQQFFLLNHRNCFFPDGSRCFFQMQRFCNRQHKNIMIPRFSNRNQRFKYLFRWLPECLCQFHTRILFCRC